MRIVNLHHRFLRMIRRNQPQLYGELATIANAEA